MYTACIIILQRTNKLKGNSVYMKTTIAEIKNLGQQIWLDNLSRGLIKSGDLKKLIEEDDIQGVTSNPSIFYKALSTDLNYKNDLKNVKESNKTLEERYESIVIPDIRATCDEMLVIYNETAGNAGYVSFELSPHLAHDTANSIKNAKRLWQEINRPNLMIKVPATKEGIATLEELIWAGINVNITLLFSVTQVKDTWSAYIKGLNRRLLENLPVTNIKAVASFFLSRIDSAIDNSLPEELQGKIAIYMAKYAYSLYLDLFNGETFTKLRSAGAMAQDLLWASTGTKNAKYSDVLYVESLIGKNTINTVPDATLDAFRDHGNAAYTLEDNIEYAKNILENANEIINLDELGEKLQEDGLSLFEKAFDDLIELMK